MAPKGAELALLLSLIDEVTKPARAVKKELAGVGKESQGLQGKLASVGSGLAAIGGKAIVGGLALVTTGAVALGAALATTIGPASDLNETISKVGVVFGDQADEVLAFGETAAQALGMSKNEALSAAGTFGNLFRSMGLAEEQSADMSTSLIQLAADLASFNNQDPTEVLEKLRAGLTGETEPLKSLGVNLNAAAVEAKAMEMGLADANGEVDAAAKAQASYALILEQTSLAQGDFARTSGGLANQQRTLGAVLKDIQSTIGTALLPLMTTLAGIVNDVLARPETQAIIASIADSLGTMAEKLSVALGYLAEGEADNALAVLFGAETALKIIEVKDALVEFGTFVEKNLGPILAGLTAAILTAVVPAFIAWAAAAIPAAAATVAAMAPVIAVMAAVGVAVGLLAAAWQNDWGGIRTTLTQVWENTLRPALETLRTWLETNIPIALQFLSDVWNNVLLPAIRAVWSFLDQYIIPLLGALGEVWLAIVSKEVEALAGLWQNMLLPALKVVWKWLGDMATVIGEKLQPVLEWLKDKALPPIAAGFKAVGDAIKGAIDWLKKLADRIRNTDLGVFQPGSPTPFELGLRGIGDAMRDLERHELPRLQASLTATGAAAGNTTNNTYHQYTINASYRYQDERSLTDDIRMLQLLGAGA